VKTKHPSILNLSFSWLLLPIIVVTSGNDISFFENDEFRDSIELEKEIEDGEKKVHVFLRHTFSDEQVTLEHQITSSFHACKESIESHSLEKFYILYHQRKSWLG